MSQAIRRVMTVVLPVPAPATISSGPVSWVTARRCASLSPSRMRSAAMLGQHYTSLRPKDSLRHAAARTGGHADVEMATVGTLTPWRDRAEIAPARDHASPLDHQRVIAPRRLAGT